MLMIDILQFAHAARYAMYFVSFNSLRLSDAYMC